MYIYMYIYIYVNIYVYIYICIYIYTCYLLRVEISTQKLELVNFSIFHLKTTPECLFVLLKVFFPLLAAHQRIQTLFERFFNACFHFWTSELSRTVNITPVCFFGHHLAQLLIIVGVVLICPLSGSTGYAMAQRTGMVNTCTPTHDTKIQARMRSMYHLWHSQSHGLVGTKNRFSKKNIDHIVLGALAVWNLKENLIWSTGVESHGISLSSIFTAASWVIVQVWLVDGLNPSEKY